MPARQARVGWTLDQSFKRPTDAAFELYLSFRRGFRLAAECVQFDLPDLDFSLFVAEFNPTGFQRSLFFGLSL